MELTEAPRLPIPLTDSLLLPQPPPGSIISPPDTVYIYRELRVPPERAFDIVEATVDSASVVIYGNGMDCHFRAPAHGEKLTIVLSDDECHGFVSGSPVARQVEVPKEMLREQEGFFDRVLGLIERIFLLVGLVFVAAIVVAALRIFR